MTNEVTRSAASALLSRSQRWRTSMPTDEQIKAAAKAMAEKRRELIAQPLSRIWDDLAYVALEAACKGLKQ